MTHCNDHLKRMANPVCEVLLTEALLEAPEHDGDPAAGAVVDFWGVVRGVETRRQIEGIEYEAHREMAEHQLRLVAETATEKFQLKKVMVHHRVGFVRTGEASLLLQVRAQHRAAAFEAGKWIVDELKKKVPIWKRPRFTTDPVSPRLPPGNKRHQATVIRR
jgi:molybdopterin synthase catalytic subunit